MLFRAPFICISQQIADELHCRGNGAEAVGNIHLAGDDESLALSCFKERRGFEVARAEAERIRSGMTAVNSIISFASVAALPFGGVGDSGFGRIHGDDGLREFARPKAITKRRAPSLLPALTFDRTPKTVARIVQAVRLIHGRR